MIVNCAVDGKPFHAVRPQAKYCSARCRKRAQRGTLVEREPVTRQKITPSVPKDDGEQCLDTITADNSLVRATRATLEAAGVSIESSQSAALAMQLAQQMALGHETAGGMASLSKELSRVTAEAVRSGMAQMADPVDELRARREAKRAG